MKTSAFLIHALSPLHAGTGQSVDIIDLPIARMRATGIPIVPGSTIKGVLRDIRKERGELEEEPLLAVFGPETKEADKHAGALMIGDARLLALPVRSFKGTFAWATCPMLLALARRDLEDAGLRSPPRVAPTAGTWARVGSIDGPSGSLVTYQGRVYLEDLDLEVAAAPEVAAWGALLANQVATSDAAWLERRFVVVDDETMSFFWETQTQLDTRVRIDAERRTVADGALWIEESLPPETLLLGLACADRSRRKDHTLSAEQVLAQGLREETVLQLGGKATVGRGRCRLLAVREVV